MKIHYAFMPAPGVYVSDLEYHEHGPHAGYITAHTTFQGKYVRDTVFRVYDPRNEHGMCLVRIEQSYFHPAARKHWAKIEPVSYTHLDVYKRQGPSAHRCRGSPR